MNQDNHNKATIGKKVKDSLKEQLEFLKNLDVIQDFKTQKFGYPGKRKDQFNVNYYLTLKNGEKWIIYSTNSLSTDRIKSKQWDAEHIKRIDSSVSKAILVLPDTIKDHDKKTNYFLMLRYRSFIQNEEWVSSLDDILLQSELIDLLENIYYGEKLAGKKSAKKGLNFEKQLKEILTNEQNFFRWKGDTLSVGWQYDVFNLIVNKIGLSPDNVTKLEADTDLASLPTYFYKDGTTKPGGNPKTDLLLTVVFTDESIKKYTFSCKSSTRTQIRVHQFPPKYAMEILDIAEPDTEHLLNEYTISGGPTNMEEKKYELLKNRLSSYTEQLSVWSLHGTDKHCLNEDQLANYIITRYQQKKPFAKDYYNIETIEECIEHQKELSKGDFGTIFSWTVTKKDKKTGKCSPQLRIYFDKKGKE